MGRPVNLPKLDKLGRGGGSWYWDLKDECVVLRHVVDGKRYTERAYVKALRGNWAAAPAHAIHLRDERRGALTTKASLTERGESTVADVHAKWFATRTADWSPSQRSKMRWAMETVAPTIGDRPIHDVTVEEIEDLLGSLNAGYAKGSVTIIRSMLNQTFAYAKRLKYVPVNIMAEVVTPAGGRARAKPRYLDADDAHRMHHYLDSRDDDLALVMMVMLTTALRPGEAAAVHWADVDLDAGTVAVAHGMRRDGGREYVSDHLKTRSSRRTVMIEPGLVAALRRHRVRQTANRLARKTWAAGDLVFTTPEGTMIRQDKLGHAVRAAVVAAGTTTITPNGFRHTNASALLAAGMTYPAVAQHMGHDDTTMLIEVYGHSTVDIVDTTAAIAAMATG